MILPENPSTQEVFDYVVHHLLTQNDRSKDDSGGLCRYRSQKNGKVLACAVGCLIPDSEYSEALEYHEFTELVNAYFDLVPSEEDEEYEELVNCADSLSEETAFLLKENFGLLSKLQILHDSHPIMNWENELKELAIHNKLIWNYNPQN